MRLLIATLFTALSAQLSEKIPDLSHIRARRVLTNELQSVGENADSLRQLKMDSCYVFGIVEAEGTPCALWGGVIQSVKSFFQSVKDYFEYVILRPLFSDVSSKRVLTDELQSVGKNADSLRQLQMDSPPAVFCYVFGVVKAQGTPCALMSWGKLLWGVLKQILDHIFPFVKNFF